MSTRNEEIPVHNECVDVDYSAKENGSMSEITCDSGIDSADSYSVVPSALSDSEISLSKCLKNGELLDAKQLKEATENAHKNGSNSSLTSPSSISPDINDVTDNLLSFDDFSLNKTDKISHEINHIISTKENANEDIILLDGNAELHVFQSSDSDSLTESINDLQSTSQRKVSTAKMLSEIDMKQLDLESRNLTSSSVSLNENPTSAEKNTIISKTPHSRSVDDISTMDHESENVSLNYSTKELNTEKILSEFPSQKNKASATQKIIPKNLQPQRTQDNTQTNLDIRYTRIPKELLAQDLGSIVKNVHGIFSSVSGSLKNAYNNTHRVTIQKPPVKTMKPIPNSKVMDDIFEDEQILKKFNVVQVNGTDGATYNTEIFHTEEAKPTNVEGIEVENEMKRDILKLQVESLERVVAEQRKENSALRERIKQQSDEMQEKEQTYKDMEVKVDLMSKRVEQAEREKDAAVMRYASVECAAIEARRAAERAVTAERAAVSEAELLHHKLRSAHGEKQRICQMYDDKCHEVMNSERELAKVREDLRELEGRLKWTQSKLRMEMDAYKDSAERAEKLSQQISELEAAKEAAAASATDSARAKHLEAELKESQAALILCRHEKEELERRLASTAHRLDTCTRERDAASSALATTTDEVERLKVSNLRLEEEAAELAALRAQAALADTLGVQLQRESERAAQAEEALSRERARAETCARREAAALEHAARLTAQHVAQRARAADHEAKTQALSLDNASLRERICVLEAEGARLQAALAEEAERRHKESRVLARKVAELSEEVAETEKKLEWEKGENCVLKKKHASAIKELNRELHRALKRCEQLEAKLPPPDATSDRTGSISSLSSAEGAPHEDRLHNGHTEALPDIQVREPDRQALIERIVSLQRAAARRSERCEFLEEHARQLTAELRAKARLLRGLLCALPAGAVASQDSDAHKKEIARLGGGAMAAVWGGDPAGMTLELSLEMNKRLQAVLEDALLKNITLKENMDTLGEEIARLKQRSNSVTE